MMVDVVSRVKVGVYVNVEASEVNTASCYKLSDSAQQGDTVFFSGRPCVCSLLKVALLQVS